MLARLKGIFYQVTARQKLSGLHVLSLELFYKFIQLQTTSHLFWLLHFPVWMLFPTWEAYYFLLSWKSNRSEGFLSFRLPSLSLWCLWSNARHPCKLFSYYYWHASCTEVILCLTVNCNLKIFTGHSTLMGGNKNGCNNTGTIENCLG